MLQNSVCPVIRGKCGIFLSGLGGHRKLITVCRHGCTVIYVTATRAVTEYGKC